MPWITRQNLIKVPFFWEDDSFFPFPSDYNITRLKQREGIKVFNFHPIHVFLNNEKTERYEKSRPYHHTPETLLRFRNRESFGSRTALEILLGLKK